MARPTNEQRALRAILHLLDDGSEQLDELITWLESENRLAGDRFDKGQQARIGQARRMVARLSQAWYRVRRRADEGIAGDFINLDEREE